MVLEGLLLCLLLGLVTIGVNKRREHRTEEVVIVDPKDWAVLGGLLLGLVTWACFYQGEQEEETWNGGSSNSPPEGLNGAQGLVTGFGNSRPEGLGGARRLVTGLAYLGLLLSGSTGGGNMERRPW